MQNTDAQANPTRPINTGNLFLIAALLVVVAVAAFQIIQQNQPKPLPGYTAPDFELTTYEGGTVRLSELKGSIVIVNFWGSWCGPCREEVPELQHIWEEYHNRGVIILGIGWKDTEAEALEFLNKNDITYPTGLDADEHIVSRYNVKGAPENFVIGPDGKIHEAILGPTTYNQLILILDEMLADQS